MVQIYSWQAMCLVVCAITVAVMSNPIGEPKKDDPCECPKTCPEPFPVECQPGDRVCKSKGVRECLIVCGDLAISCVTAATVETCVPESIKCNQK